ncbi:MerR family transcriptional regulator [Oryzobacter sp. R7]|uniref:MerR family transcriptional regulator n=1 Tax=Oryzobacter faecalis TaxID=3388656 RepID=UPI00398CDEFF
MTSRRTRRGASAPSAQGVYGISVAAGMVGTGVQNLRAYEARGLVTPDRTPGGTRLYSADDVERLQRITGLLDDGLNLAGISMVLELEDANTVLREENSALRSRSDE